MNMSVSEAIDYFKRGAGWWDGSFPRAVGHALATIAETHELNMDEPVTIEKERWETGSGPYHSYHYRYRVQLPQPVAIEDSLIQDAVTSLFGGCLPRMKTDDDDHTLIFEYQK